MHKDTGMDGSKFNLPLFRENEDLLLIPSHE